jgi:hypothetical protein
VHGQRGTCCVNDKDIKDDDDDDDHALFKNDNKGVIPDGGHAFFKNS